MVEVIVSLGIFSIVVGAIFFLFFGGQSLSLDSSNQQIAVEYASEGIDAVRQIRDEDWDNLTDGNFGLVFSGGKWQFSGASDTRGIFTRQITVSEVDANTKKIISKVIWKTDPTRTQSVTLVEELTSWLAPLIGGCATDPLSGDWTNPQTLGTADLGPGAEGTDVVVSLPYVYVSASSSDKKKADIFAFDASNPSSPQLLSSYDAGDRTFYALYVSGDYVYAATNHNNKELVVIDISNPNNISEAASLNLTGSEDAISIFGVENTVYLGREEGGGDDFFVIDVSNPANPVIVKSFEIDDDVQDIFASNKRLYLVTEDSKSLWIYDIEDPNDPVFLNKYVVSPADDLLSVGLRLPADVLAGSDNGTLFVLGATTTSQVYIRDSLNLGGSINDVICVADNLAFLATSNSGKEFIIVNIANRDNIVEYASLNYPQIGTGIDYAENKVFMSVRSNDSLRIIGPGP